MCDTITNQDKKIIINFLKEQLKEFKEERRISLKEKYYGWVDDLDKMINWAEKHIDILEQDL